MSDDTWIKLANENLFKRADEAERWLRRARDDIARLTKERDELNAALAIRTKERDAASEALTSAGWNRVIKDLTKQLYEALGKVSRLTKERDEAREAFFEVYDSLIATGLPGIATRRIHDLRERLRKEASGE